MHRKTGRWLLAAGLAMLTACVSIAPATALGIDVSAFELDNGMQVIVIPDRRAPVVTHMVWYRVGAADEPKGKAGLAHFFEHLMFKGTTRFPGGAFSRMIRANGGEENAFTTQDFTAYFQRIAREHLSMVMELEADRMQNLVLTDESVLPERSVVEEERRQRIDNDPASLLAEQVDAALYTAHPYGKPVIGWMAEVAGLTREDALAFHSTHYRPDNAILIVAGDVSADEVEALARRHYGALVNPAGPPPPRVRTPEATPVAERRVILRDARAGTAMWQRKYLAPAARHLPQREEWAMALLADILGGGNQGRLSRRLSVDLKLAAHAGAWFSGDWLDHGTFGLYAAPNPGIAIETLEQAIDAEVAALISGGVTQDELDRARNRVIASSIYLLESQQSLARMFGTALATGQTIDDVLNWEKDIAGVTVADVQAAARRVLVPAASVTGILLPEKAP